MSENNFNVGVYNGQFDELLDTNLPKLSIIQSDGLEKHIAKRHPSCLKYFSTLFIHT